MKKLYNLKPLHLYLLGSALSIVSGLLIRPHSETAHIVMLLMSLIIIVMGVVKYFRS